MSEDRPISEADLTPPPVTAPEATGFGVGSVIMLVLGLAITAVSLVALVLRWTQPADAGVPAGSSELLGLSLAVVTGLVWIAAAREWWHRRLATTVAGSVVALVLGAAAAWLIRQP